MNLIFIVLINELFFIVVTQQQIALCYFLYKSEFYFTLNPGLIFRLQACRENHVDVVALLLDNGCSVNANFPNSRENPLTLAAEKGTENNLFDI